MTIQILKAAHDALNRAMHVIPTIPRNAAIQDILDMLSRGIGEAERDSKLAPGTTVISIVQDGKPLWRHDIPPGGCPSGCKGRDWFKFHMDSVFKSVLTIESCEHQKQRVYEAHQPSRAQAEEVSPQKSHPYQEPHPADPRVCQWCGVLPADPGKTSCTSCRIAGRER